MYCCASTGFSSAGLVMALALAGRCSATLSSAQLDGGGESALVVGERACLFLDDHFIAEKKGLKRVWHQGRPQPEPVIRATEPWEKWPHMFGSVFFDPKAGVYRMYYESAIFPARKPPTSFTTYICYAESRDGKTWTKPRLGLHEDLGSKENNIVLAQAETASVWLDPNDPDPKGRLKMSAYSGGPGRAMSLYRSAAGLRWEYMGPSPAPGHADPMERKFTDCDLVSYDPRGRRYLAQIRSFPRYKIAEAKDNRRRSIGISISKDLVKGWSKVVTVLRPDERDDAEAAKLSRDPAKPDWAELYTMPVFAYGNHYLGMLSLIHFIDGSDSLGGGDLQLAFSHDGLRWQRPETRPTLIARSNVPGLFPTYAMGNHPLEIGDELWLYYTEANGAHPIAPFAKAVSQIRAAVWRRDGFVSLDAVESATLTTKPLRCDGRRLVLNLTTTAQGSARAALLDDKGQALSGFSSADCEPLRGDQVRGAVRWKGAADLSRLQGKTVRLRLALSHGSLYSFRFESDSASKSPGRP